LEPILGEATGPKSATYNRLDSDYDSDHNPGTDRVRVLMAQHNHEVELQTNVDNNDGDEDYVNNLDNNNDEDITVGTTVKKMLETPKVVAQRPKTTTITTIMKSTKKIK
jgi:hypothetical protein